ncbi:MmcQ/YjbR family DNA-binding protein [Flavobacterium agricola]|uniref:MmcQ/YjbR family DNA-binding protein n=1 Tax=Flavobacterium agricola TaxID=2870839 RepID=A0ABY6M447_9FLAO|nr:MmcQ/YjbR family DNA-binding protein [Flavobacterium agricola]UYW01868.1 MmcQ/YjbR family DNA-binding protein [Flavobacterium agricola]
MDLVQFIDLVQSFGSVTYDTPFDENTLVFRIGGKIFLLTDIAQWDSNEPRMNIKALPENVEKYLANYSFVEPGYHMNKKHWVTVTVNQVSSQNLLKQWIHDSYNLVFNSLTKKLQAELLENK